MDYIEQLVDGFEKKAIVEGFDSLINILLIHCLQVPNMETKEEIDPLVCQLRKLYKALYNPDTQLSVVYNDPVDVYGLSEVQRAYFMGYFAALTDSVTETLVTRPHRSELNILRENIPILSEIAAYGELSYDSVVHDPLIHAGGITDINSGGNHVVRLTPFGRNLIDQEYQKRYIGGMN